MPEKKGQTVQRPQAVGGEICDDRCGHFEYLDRESGVCAAIRGDNVVEIGSECKAAQISLDKALLRQRILAIGKEHERTDTRPAEGS